LSHPDTKNRNPPSSSTLWCNFWWNLPVQRTDRWEQLCCAPQSVSECSLLSAIERFRGWRTWTPFDLFRLS
jgi:hypothetical protein